MTRLAQTADGENALAATAFTQAGRMGRAGGKGTTEAERLVATSLKGRIAIQATIVAMKDIAGQTVWLLVGATVMMYLSPCHKKETAWHCLVIR